jgi:flagellar biosynthesis chaperone FliJ
MENILNMSKTNSNDDMPYLAVNNDVPPNEFIFGINMINNMLSLELIIKKVNYFKEKIQDGSLIRMNKYEFYNNISDIITSKNTSSEYMNIYIEFMEFLELHIKQCNDKYNDLIEYIWGNMTCEEKEKMPKDNNNNILLIAKPYLERSSNIHYLNVNIIRDNMYKTITKINEKLKNIFQYENQYSNKISSNNSCDTSAI